MSAPIARAILIALLVGNGAASGQVFGAISQTEFFLTESAQALNDRALGENLCNTREERRCYRPVRNKCKRKFGDRKKRYRKCKSEGREKCCARKVDDENRSEEEEHVNPYSDLEEGEEFYEEVWADFSVICEKDLATKSDVADLEFACLEYSNGSVDWADFGVEFKSFVVLDFEYAKVCEEKKSGSRRELIPKRRRSRMQAQQRGVCNGCTRKRKQNKKKGTGPDLVKILNDAGFKDVDSAWVQSVNRQDCSKRSNDCVVGKVCCGVKGCNCEPFELPS